MIKTIAPLRLLAPVLPLLVGAVPAVAAAPAPEMTQPTQIIPLPLAPVIPAPLRTCTAKTASGLGTMQLKAAQGPKPARGDYVLVNYIGYLAADGLVFDQGAGAAFPSDGLIPGFTEGLLTMSKGSIMRLCVPAALGYGDKASGPIPAKSDLVFQVELLDFKTESEINELRKQREAEAAAKGGSEDSLTIPAEQPKGK